MKAQRAFVVGGIAALVAGFGTACSSSGGGSGSAAAKVSPPAIGTAGQITWCSDLNAPPMEYFDAKHSPTGADVEIANEIARRMGVHSKWRETKFASIVPTLVAKQCDAIQSELYIKPERERVVDFLPYFKSGQSILVKKGNPEKITGLDDTLCGKRVSTTIATTAYELIKTQSGKCTSAGKSEIKILLFQSDIDALQQLALGRSDAYATTSETAAYYLTKQKNTYEFVGGNYATITAGIAVNKGNAKLLAAMKTAFAAMQSDGTYKKILAKYQLSRNAIG